MNEDILHIKFDNRQFPKVQFDLVQLDGLIRRPNLNHKPTQLHKVDFFIILWVTEGNGIHSIDFTEYPLVKGSVLTIRKDQIHKFFETNLQGYLLLFTEEFVLNYLEKQEAVKTLQVFNELLGSPFIQLNEDEHKDMDLLTDEIRKEYFQKKDKYSVGIIRSLLHILISKLYRAKSEKSLLVENKRYLEEFILLQRLVEDNCFHSKAVKFYAEQMGVSTKTLNNIVQSIVHKSAKIFIDEILITQIKRLLIHSPLSIKEIAYQSGFEEPTNLYKYFRKYTDITPELFRKTHT